MTHSQGAIEQGEDSKGKGGCIGLALNRIHWTLIAHCLLDRAAKVYRLRMANSLKLVYFRVAQDFLSTRAISSE